MTVERIPGAAAARQSAGEILVDGLFTGMLGALTVALWFLILDLMWGRPLYTPALLGSILLHGAGAAAGPIAMAPLEIAAYTAFHFVAFVAVGVLFAWLMSLFERFPVVFFVLVVLFACLQVGFVGLSLALHLEAPERLPAWSVMVANLLAAAAMATFQARRHPGALRGVEKLWEHTD
jgi:hypothetical protein